MLALTNRRSGALLTVAALLLGLFVAALVRPAPAHACDYKNDPLCVGVGTGDPGSPGGGGGGSQPPGGGGNGGGTGPSKPDPCAKYPGGFHDLCAKAQGVQCLSLYDQYATTLSLDALNELFTVNNCPTLTGAAAPPPSPATLAEQAAASFKLPLPSGHRSPSEDLRYRGFPHTYVNLWTFYWTDAGSWKTLTATARAGGNYATVTARPVSLTFDPGNGDDAVSCGGPGRPWQESDGNDSPNQGACGYQYKQVTGPGYDHPVTSTQTITWELTWTGSGNSSGTLTQRSTSTTGQLNVLQIQTVNCDPDQCGR
jgi:hypothetical protein